MSFECARCHEYVAGVGVDPPQFCNDCDGQRAQCVTCGKEFDWPNPGCACPNVHGEWTRPLPGEAPRPALAKVKLARLKIDLTCVCGTETKGVEVVLRREGSAPVICNACGESFSVTFLKEPPTRIAIDIRDKESPVKIVPRKGQPS